MENKNFEEMRIRALELMEDDLFSYQVSNESLKESYLGGARGGASMAYRVGLINDDEFQDYMDRCLAGPRLPAIEMLYKNIEKLNAENKYCQDKIDSEETDKEKIQIFKNKMARNEKDILKYQAMRELVIENGGIK